MKDDVLTDEERWSLCALLSIALGGGLAVRMFDEARQKARWLAVLRKLEGVDKVVTIHKMGG